MIVMSFYFTERFVVDVSIFSYRTQGDFDPFSAEMIMG